LRFLDEKGRVFGKISIIDLVIVIVLLTAGGWFAYAKFGKNLGQDIAARERSIEFTIVVATIRPATVEALTKGGKAFEFKTGAALGTVTKVTTEPSEVWTINEDGKWLKTTDTNRLDAYVTVAGTARESESTITVNGVEIRVGLSIGITTKWAQVNGYVLTVNLPEGAPK
jgi:hypothetical protein